MGALHIEDVCFVYEDLDSSRRRRPALEEIPEEELVLKHLDLEVADGEFVCIVGHSGCGKSTILRILAGLQAPVCGQISIGGRPLEGPGLDRSVVFQNYSLFPWMTAKENIEFGINQASLELGRNLCKGEVSRIADEHLAKVNMSKAADLYPYQLSGGMRQRAMIAMALASNPRLLVADEPTTSLDVTVQAQILDLMKDLQQEMGMSILMINHNFGIIAETCDAVAVMYLGRIVETASTKDLLENPMHPYTQDLFRSIPQVTDQRGKRLEYIEGSVPDAYSIPKGCAYFPRCRKAQKGLCDESLPPVVDLGNGRMVSCFRYDQ